MNVIPSWGRSDETVKAKIREALAGQPDGILEFIASKIGAPLGAVFDELPQGSAVRLPGDRFEEIWTELASWGDVLLIVHTPDIVLECTGSLPSGSFARGYYNVHGNSPISGHIKADNCAAIYLIDRPFHGRRSCSVQFLNAGGEAMFKIFGAAMRARS